MAAVMAEIGPALKPGATLSDVGSVKQAVIDVVAPPQVSAISPGSQPLIQRCGAMCF